MSVEDYKNYDDLKNKKEDRGQRISDADRDLYARKPVISEFGQSHRDHVEFSLKMVFRLNWVLVACLSS